MKKFISIAIAALCALCLVSCDDFLDYSSQGVIAQDNFFLTDEQANSAIENCYYGLFERDGMFSREIYWEQGCANDMVWGKTRGFPSLATLSYTGNESVILDSWNRIYNRYGIPKANWVVNSLTSFARSITCSPPTATAPRSSESPSWLTRMSRVATTTPSPRSSPL